MVTTLDSRVNGPNFDPSAWLGQKELAAWVGPKKARALLSHSQHRDWRNRPIVLAADAADALELMELEGKA